MSGLGTKILATDFNTIQSLATQVLGTGSGTYGYGQTVASSQVSSNSIISTTQWRNLRTDILRCRQHQTGTDLSSVLEYPTTSLKVTETIRAAYASMMADAAADAARLAPPPAGEAERNDIVTMQSRSTNWNGTLTQTITVDFTSAEAARFYFNSGGRFEISSSRSGGSNTAKDQSWTALLGTGISGMGVVYFNRSSTTCTGTGNTTSIGWAGLSSANQVIFSKDVSGTTYAPNQYKIQARAPSSTQIVFTIQWLDASVDSPPANAPWYIDEDVTGTLTSSFQYYRASGSNVSVPAPTGSTTSIG